jgi:hypothetical protein
MENGKLAEDFEKGKKPLIPIVFAHGLSAARNFHQMQMSEIASCGYLVFV